MKARPNTHADASPADTRVLFVAWQEPESRAYRPVGRLVRTLHPDTGHPRFEFTYTHGTDDAVGFTPFMAFPDRDRLYHAEQLFPFFTNRLMSPRRPEYPLHLRRLGLQPGADPFDVLVRTGGIRDTDAIELFGRPELSFDASGQNICYETHFLIHGFAHLQPQEREALLALTPGDALRCCPEPHNPADRHAMFLVESENVKVGYLPRYLAPDAADLQSACGYLHVTVEQVNPEPAPIAQRLLCKLASCVPTGYQPFQSRAYQPRHTDAVTLPGPHVADSSLAL